MASYNGMYRSTEASVTDINALKTELLEDTVLPEGSYGPEDAVQMYNIDGEMHVQETEEGTTIWFGSEETTFAVWDSEYRDELTDEFLERLSEYLEEELVIRSVGHTGLRHIPDAYQLRVSPNGNINMERLEE